MFNNIDEDNIAIPAEGTEPLTEVADMTIAERVAIGIEQGTHLNGAIVPFPAKLAGKGILDALTGEERKKVNGLRTYGFLPTVHEYRDEQGRLLQALVRFDHKAERKIIMPLRYCGKDNDGADLFWFTWIRKKKPLYGLDLLAVRPDADVLVVEGEKAADAARLLFPDMVVISWASGAGAVRRAEMIALAGRKLVCWPDNDVAGRRAMRLFAALAIEAGADEARIVSIPREFPAKWDLADPLEATALAEHPFADLIAAAVVVTAAEAAAILSGAQRKAEARRMLGHKAGYSKVDVDAALVALEAHDPNVGAHAWRSMARTWYHAFGEAGLESFDGWSSAGDKYRAGEVAEMWAKFKADEHFAAPSLASLFRRARKLIDADKRNVTLDDDAFARAHIEEINENHTVVTRGSKTVVMWEEYDPRFERYKVSYLKRGDFVEKHIRQLPTPPKKEGKEGGTVPAGKHWFSGMWRRQYEGIHFMPGGDVPFGYLNSWQGFQAVPADNPAGWSLLKEHLFEHICGRDQESFDYVMNWLAFGVQHLDRPVGTALVLTGPKGAGKSILIELYGYLFGDHTFVTSHSEDIVGKFNAHLETTLLLGVEEAFAPQNRAADGTLKDMLTRKTLRLEDKFFSTWTAPNHLRVIMTSNNDHVVRADGADRRYAVFEVVNPHQGSPHARRKYFGAMVAQMETGGYEAMLGELLARDISDWNPEAIPETEALRKQKLLNLSNDPTAAWWASRLEDGGQVLSGDADTSIYEWQAEGPTWVPVAAVLADYSAFAQRHGHRGDDQRLKGKLKKFMPADFSSQPRRLDEVNGARTVRMYPFPPLEEARRLFEAATGYKIE